MCQSDDTDTIKQWDIYILLDLYYNGAPVPIITQLLSVLVNSYHHAGIPSSCLFQQLNLTDELTGLIVYFW